MRNCSEKLTVDCCFLANYYDTMYVYSQIDLIMTLVSDQRLRGGSQGNVVGRTKGGLDWRLISEDINRPVQQCYNVYQHECARINSLSLKKGSFTPSEVWHIVQHNIYIRRLLYCACTSLGAFHIVSNACYTMCCILHTIYYILYTIYYILYTIYYILYTIYYTLYTIYYILYSIYYILYSIYYIL